MKINQRTIKVYDSTRRTLGKLSDRYGISMSAIVDALAQQMENNPRIHLEIPPKDKRYKKTNARRAAEDLRQVIANPTEQGMPHGQARKD